MTQVIEEKYVWIITQDPSAPGEGDDKGNKGDEGTHPWDKTTSSSRPGTRVKAKKLEDGMLEFLTVVGHVFKQVNQRTVELAGIDLDEIELSVEINGEGQVSLWGTGGKVGSKGGMTLRFKRVEPKGSVQAIVANETGTP